MIRATAIYKTFDGATFDFDDYHNKHMKMSSARFEKFGLIGYQVERGIEELDGSNPTYICITGVDFSDIESLRAGLAQHAEELMADLPQYTNIETHVQINEVVVTRHNSSPPDDRMRIPIPAPVSVHGNDIVPRECSKTPVGVRLLGLNEQWVLRTYYRPPEYRLTPSARSVSRPWHAVLAELPRPWLRQGPAGLAAG